MPKHKLPDETWEEIIKLYQQGITMGKITKMFSISQHTLKKVLIEKHISLHTAAYYLGKKFSSDEQQQVIELYKKGKTIRNIAKNLNTSPESISRILEENNVKKRDIGLRSRKISPEQEKKVIELYLKGLSQEKIAKKFDVETVTIGKVLKRNNIETRYKGKKKIFETHENEIVKLYQTDYSIEEICKLMNLSPSSIFKVLKKNEVYDPGTGYNTPPPVINPILHTPIILLYEKGQTINKIAKKYNVCAQTIRKILKLINIKIRPAHFYLTKILPKDKAKIIQLYKKGMSISQLAIKLDVHFQTISKILKNNGIELKPHGYNLRKLGEDDEKEIIKLYNQEIAQKKIGEQFGVSRDTISAVLKRHKIKLRETGYHVKKLNENDDKEIIRLYQEGFNTVQIAAKIGVGHATINRALERNKIKTHKTINKEQLKASEKEIIRLYEETGASKKVAKILNKSEYSILQKLKQLKLIKKKKSKIKDTAQT